jgi:hypothetical protein
MKKTSVLWVITGTRYYLKQRPLILFFVPVALGRTLIRDPDPVTMDRIRQHCSTALRLCHGLAFLDCFPMLREIFKKYSLPSFFLISSSKKIMNITGGVDPKLFVFDPDPTYKLSMYRYGSVFFKEFSILISF